LKHSIIRKLYGNKSPKRDEDAFIEEYSEKKDYIENINERKEAGFKGFFTPRMECLVNGNPFLFEVSNEQVTFVYDQGPHPMNYFKGSINGMFISDAIDTAPKLTNPSQRPVFFKTPDIVIPGSYIGFNEDVVRTVVFSGFKKSGNIFACKVVINAKVGEDFRWYDLGTNFKETDNKLTGYNSRISVLENARFKESNSRDAGFFIGNKKAAEILGNSELKPILALCLVVAKILGDFSSALAASPIIVETYGESQVKKIIQATGDRLSSFQALQQGANTIKTLRRNGDGEIEFDYIPGTFDPIKIDYDGRVKDIKAEILTRFDDLLKDVEEFDIDKYKVDGDSIDSSNVSQVNKLEVFVESLKPKIKEGKAVVTEYLKTISGEPKQQYETLLKQKKSLMPQTPTISVITTTGKRKSLNMVFHLYTLPKKPSVDFYLKVYVYNIINGKSGGKRKFHQKRIRRTPRKSRGGMNTIAHTPPNTPLFKRQRTQSPIPSDSELSTLPINNSGIVTTDDSSSELSSGTPSRKMSDSSPVETLVKESSGTSKSEEKLNVVTRLFPTTPVIDPTIPMDFPKDYVPKNSYLFEFENILNEIKNNIINSAVGNASPTNKFNELLSRPDIREFLNEVKKSDEYDEEFMKEIEEALEEKKREQEEPVDDEFIKNFLSIVIVDEPTTAGRKRKRKTYRRIRLF
jgi:hypothetical protein